MNLCPVCGSPTTDATTCVICGAQLASPVLPVGTRLANGRYSVGRLLGRGGFGMTYQGADLTLGRAVAVKELYPEGAVRLSGRTVQAPSSLGADGFQHALEGFVQEARTMAMFNDPGIVRVLDVFEENGTAYLVMEYLEGESLGKRIEREGQLSPATVERIARKLASALEQVHGAGLLHRDIKPDNLLCCRNDRIVLIDFGSARSFDQGQTVRHTRLVTVGYAPLEQYASQARFGPYTDLYALGATLYHALTGLQPPGANDRVLGADLQPLPPGTPSGLKATIIRSLALQVTDRPQNVREFLSLLDGTPSAPVVPKPNLQGTPATAGPFAVIVTHPGANKIAVIKVVRELFQHGLKEAKDLVDAAPGRVGICPTETDAEDAVKRLAAAGADAAYHPGTGPEPTPASGPSIRGTRYDLTLISPGLLRPGRDTVIAFLREINGLGIKEAKDLVDRAPCLVGLSLPAPAARVMANTLQEYGALVEVTPELPPRLPGPPHDWRVYSLSATGPIPNIAVVSALIAATGTCTWSEANQKLSQGRGDFVVSGSRTVQYLVDDLAELGVKATYRPLH